MSRVRHPVASAASRQEWLLVSMYTADYADRAATLRQSCERHGVEHRIDLVDSSEYRRTIASKPRFMLRMLKDVRRPIAYMDADFEVMAYPTLFDNAGNVDFMVYNWFADPTNAVGRYQPDVLLSSSGVLYWNDTRPARRLLTEWLTMAELNPLCADDQILDRVFNERRHIRRLTCQWLPRSYLRIAPYFPETTPVLNHADRPGQNGRPARDIREARRPWHWTAARRARAWAGRIRRLAR